MALYELQRLLSVRCEERTDMHRELGRIVEGVVTYFKTIWAFTSEHEDS
jgi:hypothetical protein